MTKETNGTELEKVCKGKTLEELWKCQEVKAVTKELREGFQAQINEWATSDHKRHIPVYISLKPKIKKLGLYFQKKRGNGAIVLFPIRATAYPITAYTVLSEADMLSTLRHEYAHHLSRDASPHGKDFQSNLKAINKRK